MKVPLAIAAALLILAPADAIAQTRITRASTSKLELQAGGDPVQVVLEGVDLSSVTEFRLLRRGRPVLGVQAVRQPIRSLRGRTAGDQLAVDLTATAAVAPGTYQLEAVVGNERILVPVSVEVMAETAAATPDIVAADPTLVQLRAGNPAKRVLLLGSGLDLVSGVRIQRNGQTVPGVRGQVLPGTAERLEVTLEAIRDWTESIPWNQPLDLMVEAPNTRLRGVSAAYPTPVKVNVLGTLPVAHVLVSRAVNDAPGLTALDASFNSCGPPSEHRFSFQMPGAPFSGSGPWQRFETAVTPFELPAFLEDHSLDPTDPFTGDLAAAMKSNPTHPSPIPHTVTAVRMCLLDLGPAGPWSVAGAGESGGRPHLTVRVEFEDAHFRVRGMPADPSGAVSGVNVGILWGDAVTDMELPDLVYRSPRYEVRLPLDFSAGTIRYLTPEVTFLGTRNARWSGRFLGAATMRRRAEEHAANQMHMIGSVVLREAFDAPATRGKIVSAIHSMLPTIDVTQILGMERGSDGQWQFVYR